MLRLPAAFVTLVHSLTPSPASLEQFSQGYWGCCLSGLESLTLPPKFSTFRLWLFFFSLVDMSVDLLPDLQVKTQNQDSVLLLMQPSIDIVGTKKKRSWIKEGVTVKKWIVFFPWELSSMQLFIHQEKIRGMLVNKPVKNKSNTLYGVILHFVKMLHYIISL